MQTGSRLDTPGNIPYYRGIQKWQNYLVSLKEACMAEETNYECTNCGHKIKVKSTVATAPECCKQAMIKTEPLPVCELSETAEHSRMEDMGEPCDDGRAGKL
jgi:DNA-directed RNA polymerase subunit RPC12/RpoP